MLHILQAYEPNTFTQKWLGMRFDGPCKPDFRPCAAMPCKWFFLL